MPAAPKKAKAKKPPEIEKLDETTEVATVLIYAYPGVGKTVFTADLPNSLILATEPGTVSAARAGKKSDVWKCYSWEKFIKAKDWLKENPDHGYTWIIVDTATTLQAKCMRYIVDFALSHGRGNGDPDVPAIQDYMKWFNYFNRIVDELIEDSNANICFVAHAMEVEHDGEEMVLPAFQGKAKEGYQIAHSFCAKMQFIGFYYIEMVEKEVRLKGGKTKKKEVRERRLLIQNTPPYVAKDRYNLGKDELVEPDMKKISDAILEYVP